MFVENDRHIILGKQKDSTLFKMYFDKETIIRN
jgi:hypothetical protein